MLKKFLILILLISYSFGGRIAIVKKAYGEVFAKRGENLQKLSIGDGLKLGDILMTKNLSGVGVLFTDGTSLSLGANSLLSIDKYIFEPIQKRFALDINMKKGLAGFESRKIGKLAPKTVKFRVPEGTVGIRGTKFYVEVK